MNENSVFKWDLWNEGFPSHSFSDEVWVLAAIDGGEGFALVGDQSFTVSANRKFDDALASHSRTVCSILDVRCGTGRSTINLALKYLNTLDYAHDVDQVRWASRRLGGSPWPRRASSGSRRSCSVARWRRSLTKSCLLT